MVRKGEQLAETLLLQKSLEVSPGTPEPIQSLSASALLTFGAGCFFAVGVIL